MRTASVRDLTPMARIALSASFLSTRIDVSVPATSSYIPKQGIGCCRRTMPRCDELTGSEW